MSEMLLMKMPGGTLAPATEDAREAINRWKVGVSVMVKARKMRERNARFHRKFFALLDYAFDCWEPPATEYEGHMVVKNREQFREEVTIAAGHYVVTYSLKGIRRQAKSIAFANMEDEEFEKVYSGVCTVILQTVLTKYTREDLDQVVDRILGFAS